MPLSDKQRTALEAKAKEAGVDPAALIREAEKIVDAKPAEAKATKADEDAPAKEKPNLYMYLLPFVTVNEVRTIWLELDAVAGGEEYAGTWAAKQAGPTAPVDPERP